MNFFERQRQVRRLSFRLVLLFIAAVAVIVLTVDFAAALVFRADRMSPAGVAGLMIVTSAITLSVIILSSLIRSLTLRSGGAVVARQLGGVQVPENTTDPRLKRLRNVVEEIAIASGAPVPDIFILPNEQAINAFAAGWSTADAAIAVTAGALDQLNRDELQGVIAHEFSHVVNGDMRLSIKLIGLLFGILVIGVAGRWLMWSRDREGGVPMALVGLMLVAAGYGGVLIGRLIKAAVSRQREYLADASAVQFTRQTAGIAGALKKIGGLTGSKLRNGRTEEVSHMLFGDGVGLSAMWATHPPLEKRIAVLDPTFDPRTLPALREEWAAEREADPERNLTAGLASGGAPTSVALPADDAPVRVNPAAVVAGAGAASPPSYQRAATILDHIPPKLADAARDPATAVPLLFGLLMSPADAVREAQLAVVTTRHGHQVAASAGQAADAIGDLHSLLRLPLAELAFPAVRHRPAADQAAILETIHELSQVDGVIDIAEYGLSRLLHRDLFAATNRRPPWPRQRATLLEDSGAVAKLLATVARAGTRDAASAGAALRAGLSRALPQEYVPTVLRAAGPAGKVTELDHLWPALDGLSPMDKSVLVEALVITIGYDGVTTVAEAELLRIICGMLGVPIPPLV